MPESYLTSLHGEGKKGKKSNMYTGFSDTILSMTLWMLKLMSEKAGGQKYIAGVVKLFQSRTQIRNDVFQGPKLRNICDYM